jgi:hypothetical protein
VIKALFFALIALSLAGFIAYYKRRPTTSPIDGRRLKWLFIALVVWAIGTRGLSTDVTTACHSGIDPLRRIGTGDDFIACSPKLLASGPADIFAFVWLWGPLLLASFFAARILIRVLRARSDSKES